jgi:hypothetical protein
MAATSRGSEKTVPHSLNGRLVARPMEALLSGERCRDGQGPTGDNPPVVEHVRGGDQLVQGSKRGHRRYRHQMAAAEPADLALDAALLVRAVLRRDAEEGIEPVMRAQRDKPLRLAMARPFRTLTTAGLRLS